jgi:hypothetical protein
MKCVFPIFWIGFFGLATCGMWFAAFRDRNGNPPPDFTKWIFFVGWLVGTAFILWLCGRLKRVQVDDEALYVSNYWSEARIPLTEVSHFTQSYMSRPPTVTIHLRSMSAVGQRIVFIPKFRWVLFGTHPIIIELQELCDRANAKGGTGQEKTSGRVFSETPMRVLQALCGIFCLLSILSAVTGIASIEVTDHVVITRHGDLGRLYAVVLAAFLALAFYGVHRRAPIAWKLGWVVLGASFLSFLGTGLSGALRQPPPGRGIISSFIVIDGSMVTVVWGLWWKHQRGYFRPRNDPEDGSGGGEEERDRFDIGKMGGR